MPLRLAHVLLRRDPRAWRHLPRWLGSLRPGVDPLRLGLPWLAFDAVRFLEAEVRSGWQVLELGAGGSTAFFRRRVRRLVTVEHDPAWVARVRAEVPAGPGFELRSAPEADFERILGGYPAGAFDLVLVDGGEDRARLARAAESRVRSGGLLVLDNADLVDGSRLLPLDQHPRRDFGGIAPWNLHGGRFHLQTTRIWRVNRAPPVQAAEARKGRTPASVVGSAKSAAPPARPRRTARAQWA